LAVIYSQTGVIKGSTSANQRSESSKLLKYLGRKYLLEVSDGTFENFTICLFLVLSVGSLPEYHWGAYMC